jgi:hypothetical protein
MKQPPLDDRDQQIRATRAFQLASSPGPTIGDYVDFADGTTRRIAHVWKPPMGTEVQTSPGGSFYLGEGYCSFSGGLDRGIDQARLTLTDEQRDGPVWFFHNDYITCDNSIETTVPFRVYQATGDAPC